MCDRGRSCTLGRRGGRCRECSKASAVPGRHRASFHLAARESPWQTRHATHRSPRGLLGSTTPPRDALLVNNYCNELFCRNRQHLFVTALSKKPLPRCISLTRSLTYMYTHVQKNTEESRDTHGNNTCTVRDVQYPGRYVYCTEILRSEFSLYRNEKEEAVSGVQRSRRPRVPYMNSRDLWKI